MKKEEKGKARKGSRRVLRLHWSWSGGLREGPDPLGHTELSQLWPRRLDTREGLDPQVASRDPD